MGDQQIETKSVVGTIRKIEVHLGRHADHRKFDIRDACDYGRREEIMGSPKRQAMLSIIEEKVQNRLLQRAAQHLCEKIQDALAVREHVYLAVPGGRNVAKIFQAMQKRRKKFGKPKNEKRGQVSV